METKLAKFISVIFHPLTMPTYGFLLIFCTKNYIATFTPFNLKLIILGVTFVFTFLLPTVNALILLRMGKIKSLEMETIAERTIPYLSTSFYFFALFYLFYSAQFPAVLSALVLGAGISILLTLIINYRWKISAHAIGIGGIIGATIGLSFRLMTDMNAVLMLVIFCAGLTGYARLKLNAHTPAQVYSGFLLGTIIELSLMFFY